MSGRAPRLAPLIVLVSEWTLNESDLGVDVGVVCGVGSSRLQRQPNGFKMHGANRLQRAG